MPNIPIAAPAIVGLAAAGGLVWLFERRRRIRLHVNGRLTEVTIFHADAGILQYGYEIGGVAYDTTQDISTLLDYLPRPAEQLLGTAVAKYDPNNPANSIIMCEHWLGFKKRLNGQ